MEKIRIPLENMEKKEARPEAQVVWSRKLDVKEMLPAKEKEMMTRDKLAYLQLALCSLKECVDLRVINKCLKIVETEIQKFDEEEMNNTEGK